MPTAGSLSGRYFCDTNNNDIDDSADPGVEGVLVTLLDQYGNPAGDITGLLLDPVETAADGTYRFDNLAPGIYTVVFTDPAGVLDGKHLVAPDVGDNTSDSDAIGDTGLSTIRYIFVEAGQDTTNNDVGVRYDTAGTVEGTVFHDLDCDGLDGTLLGRGSDVFFDPEPRIEGVRIVLLDLSNVPVAETTTDANGNYRFDDVPVGEYTVMGVAPDGTEFTIQDAYGGSADNRDSDVDSTGVSAVFRVSGSAPIDIDMGVCTPPPGSVEGRYFCDENDNGIFDGADPVLADMTVTLLDATGQSVLATTTTGTDGIYRFDDLIAGAYVVQFESGSSQGKSFVAPNVGDEETDSDVVDLFNGQTDPVAVLSGQVTTGVNAGIRYGADIEVEKDISNVVVYLAAQTPGDDPINVKFDDFDFETHEIYFDDLNAMLEASGYAGYDLLGVTVKAGNNKGGFGPGEGQFFDAHLTDDVVTGTGAHADASFDVDDVFDFI